MKTKNKMTHAERIITLTMGTKAMTREDIISSAGVSMKTFHLFLTKYLKVKKIEILAEKKDNKKLYRLTR